MKVNTNIGGSTVIIIDVAWTVCVRQSLPFIEHELVLIDDCISLKCIINSDLVWWDVEVYKVCNFEINPNMHNLVEITQVLCVCYLIKQMQVIIL